MPSLTYAEAAHLLRRAGFGGSPADINALVGREREDAVNSLVDYESADNQEVETRLMRDFPFLRLSSPGELNDENFNQTEMRAWWVMRMLLSKRPFEEKMTLFWHNHFATSLDKVPGVHMYAQNLDLRRHALARFDELLLAVSRGAAMLIWLDGVDSTKVDPNENFARELQELFTTGPHDIVTGEPNYTEADVRGIARTFTGWRFRLADGARSPFAYQSYVDENAADSGAKTIYGSTANFSGEDVITILAGRRATARFLVAKLFAFFVYPLDLESAEDRQTLERFADVYLRRNHSIKELMRAILRSDEFFSQRAFWSLIKSPVDYVVGTIKALNLSYSPGTLGEREVILQSALRDMGMNLFSPPDVSGWKVNDGFVNTETLLSRYNFGDALLFGTMGTIQPTFAQMRKYAKPNPKKAVQKALGTLGLEGLDPDLVNDLENYLRLDAAGNVVAWPPPGGVDVLKIRGLIRLIMCLPEYQLN